MLKIKIITVGALSEKHWKDACAEYRKRLSAKADLEEIQLKEEPLSKNPSAGEIKKALDAEGEKILAEIPKRAMAVSLCVEGKQYSSEALAEIIGDAAVSGVSEICFVIGSSYGLSDRVKSASRLKLSMSALTFPHQLARVMLYETVYRSFTILGGEKYHK